MEPKFARRAAPWRLRRQRYIGSSWDALELLAPHRERPSARSQRCSGRAGASAGRLCRFSQHASLPPVCCRPCASARPAVLRPSGGGCVHDLKNLKFGPKSGVPSPSRCARPSSRLTSGGLRPTSGPALGALTSFVWDRLSDRASLSQKQRKQARAVISPGRCAHRDRRAAFTTGSA
jgi:hypothetical protein